MKLIQFRYFCGVVEYGGFISASRELNVAQPALSRQISNLEKEVGCILFSRGPGGTKVTEAGQKFYAHARAILQKVDVVKAEMRTDSHRLEGAISIALPVGMASQLAVNIVQAVYTRHPGLSVNIEDGLGYQAGQAIDSGKVDFGIIANVGHLQNVTFDPVLRESLFFFVKREHPDPNTTDIELADLEGVPLIMPNRRVHVRRNLENMMIKAGRQLNIRFEQQSLLTIRSMVSAGLGATVMNWPSMADLWHTGDLDARKIINPGLTRTVCLAVPNSRPLSRAAKAAYDIVRDVMVRDVETGDWRGGVIVESGNATMLEETG
ncbi:LysR family transcriptional regulator [Nitratireductor sp. XY-223]|uniref:LysR family transcriptional regulator n=1 Tax=Nitratireductor sp. XY-223 TaxID=2561926 RepID=UPI00145B5CF8|nr:LysR family transcriptional regulator [Nitratireductor sp. XY-223]